MNGVAAARTIPGSASGADASIGTGGASAFGSIGSFNPAMLVHGEQAITLHGPIPVQGEVETTGEITGTAPDAGVTAAGLSAGDVPPSVAAGAAPEAPAAGGSTVRSNSGSAPIFSADCSARLATCKLC